jgi:TrmH family RNA methyltransferase
LVFFAPELATGHPAIQALMTRIGRDGIEWLEVSTAVFAALAETMTPQGIAAIVDLPRLALAQPSTLALILDGVRDPGNAGTLLRAAEAAGVDRVIFGPESVDPFNDKVMRAGMGAHFRLPVRECDRWEDVTEYLAAGQAVVVADAAAQLDYDRFDWRQPTALVIGGEANGPSHEARVSGQAIGIPMRGGTESLNAAMAGTAILFEAARQRRLA